MPNLIVSAVSTFDNKGLKKGRKEVSAFEKQLKNFTKVFAGAFSISALTNYSKNAVKAFMADEKAAKSLEQQLKNTGYQFSAPGIEQYISNLQKTTGVLDDEIRPAFQKLLSVTGSITLSQDALATALNTSAAGYGSVVEVSQALAKGFAGETTALKRLVPGLDKAALKSGDMNKIMAQLNEKFKGQSAARLDTYAGKMDLLTVASENAKEIIGKGLLDSLTLLSKDKSIATTATAMENLATEISNTTLGMADLIAKTKELLNLKTNSNEKGMTARSFVPLIGGLLDYFGDRGAKLQPNTLPENQKRSAGRISSFQFKQEEIARKKLLAALKAEEALKKLKDKYDLERIGLMAALNAATDEETKVRLAEKLAILDGNAAMRDKYLLDKINAEALENTTEAANKLATSFTSLGEATIEYFKKLSESLVGTMAYLNMSIQQILQERLRESGKTSLGGGMIGGGFTPLTASYFQNLGSQLQGSSAYAGMSAGDIALERARESGNRSLDVNLVVSAPSGNAFAQLVAESIQVAGRSGYSTTGAGQLP